MYCTLLVSLLSSIQPFCDKPLYAILEQHLDGDTRFIAEVIYEEYLEEIRELDVQQDGLVSPISFLQTQREEEIKADLLFDVLLDSISVLQNGNDWKNALQTVRRRALLSAREVHNPWPNTTWFDVATVGVTSYSVLNSLDIFLLQYADADRADRFAAKIAKLQGDQKTCANAERRTMERWAIFNNLIGPIETVQTLVLLYPALRLSDDGVGEMLENLTGVVLDDEQKKAIENIVSLHTTLYEKNIFDLVSLVKQARITEGVDLLSSGCGTAMKSKNEILQKTAEIHELNKTTIKSVKKVLSKKQLQELVQEG